MVKVEIDKQTNKIFHISYDEKETIRHNLDIIHDTEVFTENDIKQLLDNNVIQPKISDFDSFEYKDGIIIKKEKQIIEE